MTWTKENKLSSRFSQQSGMLFLRVYGLWFSQFSFIVPTFAIEQRNFVPPVAMSGGSSNRPAESVKQDFCRSAIGPERNRDAIGMTSYSQRNETKERRVSCAHDERVSRVYRARRRPRHVSMAGLIADSAGKVRLNGHYSGEITHNLRFKCSPSIFRFVLPARGTKGSLFFDREPLAEATHHRSNTSHRKSSARGEHFSPSRFSPLQRKRDATTTGTRAITCCLDASPASPSIFPRARILLLRIFSHVLCIGNFAFASRHRRNPRVDARTTSPVASFSHGWLLRLLLVRIQLSRDVIARSFTRFARALLGLFLGRQKQRCSRSAAVFHCLSQLTIKFSRFSTVHLQLSRPFGTRGNWRSNGWRIRVYTHQEEFIHFSAILGRKAENRKAEVK